MARKQLAGMRVAVLAADGFEQLELTSPLKHLRKHGAEVKILSLRPGSIRGMNLMALGKKVSVDETLGHADPADFDALFIPGGYVNPDFLRQSERALTFVQAFDRAQKPIAVICHAPWVLASANLVQGRRLTSWPGISDDLLNAGAIWVDSPVVRDRNWISSRGPNDLPAFNAALVEFLAERIRAVPPREKRSLVGRLVRVAAVGASAYAARRAYAALTA